MSEPQAWSINPSTMKLEGVEGKLSEEEFRRIERPPCPACGRTIYVVPIRMPSLKGVTYMAGRWGCHDCEPEKIEKALSDLA